MTAMTRTEIGIESDRQLIHDDLRCRRHHHASTRRRAGKIKTFDFVNKLISKLSFLAEAQTTIATAALPTSRSDWTASRRSATIHTHRSAILTKAAATTSSATWTRPVTPAAATAARSAMTRAPCWPRTDTEPVCPTST